MKLLVILILLMQLQHLADCSSLIILGSPTERVVRTWRERLLAQYSSRTDCIVVVFRSLQRHRLDIGVYEVTLTLSGEDFGLIANATWERAWHFPEPALGGGGGYTLLTVPLRGAIQGADGAYKLYLMPLTYRNNSAIHSIAPPSELSAACCISFIPGVAPPLRPPEHFEGASGVGCPTMPPQLPADLTARLGREFGLTLADDGCCLMRLGETDEARTIPTDPVPDGSAADAATAAAAASAAISAVVLVACCLVLCAKAVERRMRPRVFVTPSGEPYSLLAAHCRCVFTNEPLMFQGMAYRFDLRRPDLRSVIFCGLQGQLRQRLNCIRRKGLPSELLARLRVYDSGKEAVKD